MSIGIRKTAGAIADEEVHSLMQKIKLNIWNAKM